MILSIRNLTLDFLMQDTTVRAVNSLNLDLQRGETMGLVGESGSGKSVTALMAMGLLHHTAAQRISGEILYFPDEDSEPIDLLKIPRQDRWKYRGAHLSMIFQETMTSLNPVMRCGKQVAETIVQHQGLTQSEARQETLRLFSRVQLGDVQRIYDSYPHQISGGQKQRVMIAMAVSCHPAVLIADEPTTALDSQTQEGILQLLAELQQERQCSLLFISHDLAVISKICNRVAVLRNGIKVEEGDTRQVFQQPKHPYTRGLVACRPSNSQKLYRLPTIEDFLAEQQPAPRLVLPEETAARKQQLSAQPPLLEVQNLTVHYPVEKDFFGRTIKWLDAVQQANFTLFPGETLGIAGESGSGKSTLGRAIVRMAPIHSGTITYRMNDQRLSLTQLTAAQFMPVQREIQLVFQDPYSSLSPGKSIGEAIKEPMKVHNLHENDKKRQEKTIELLELIGLDGNFFKRYPHELSGGQRQRVCIARALSVQPRLLICDEIVSALDVSVQAVILNLLLDLQEKLGLSYLFISHDQNVLFQLCDRILQMGKVARE